MTDEGKQRAKLIQWLITHGWVVTLIYFGLLTQHPWAISATKFTVWLLYAPFALLAFLAPDKMSEEVKRQARQHHIDIPPWITWLIDMSFGVFLAINQMWFYAGSVAVAGMLSFALRAEAPEGEDTDKRQPDPRPLGPDYFSQGDSTDGILGESKSDGKRKRKTYGPSDRKI